MYYAQSNILKCRTSAAWICDTALLITVTTARTPQANQITPL